MVATYQPRPLHSATQLPIGRPGRIVQFADEQVGSKLMAMGILPGSRITVIRRAPFGGGYYVRVDNLVLALRKQEMENILCR